MSQTISYSTDFPSRQETINLMLKALADRDFKFLNIFLKLDDPVDGLKYEWVDKTLVGFKDTLNVALASSTTTVITVSSGTNAPKRYIDGVSLIKIESEVMLVSSTITTLTNSAQICVTRAQLSTTASSHPVNSQIVIIGNPRVEGFSAGRDDSQKGARKYNYTQIFERQLKLTGSSQEVKAVDRELLLDKQAADLTPELFKELQFALIHGIRYANDSTAYTDRKMGGFYDWAVNQGGNNTSANSNPISFSIFDDVIEAYLNNGGDGTKLCAVTSLKQQRKINDLKEARVVNGGMSQSENKISNYVTTYDFGSRAQVEIISIPDVMDNEIYFFQKDLVSVHPLGSRAWKRKPLPEDGDFVREMILGEFTAVFRNVRETLFRYYNLAV